MKKSIFRITIFLVAFIVVYSAFGQDPGAPSGNGVTPIYVLNNPNCCDLGYADFGFKLNGAPDGTFTFTNEGGELTCGKPPQDPNNSVTISTTDGIYFNWNSTLSIDAVIVKGGNNANVYVYDPESKGDTELHPPINPNNGKPYAISHIEFCYDYEVDVEKNAKTTYTRTYNWKITKEVTPETWALFKGDDGTSNYTVSIEKTGYTDRDWAVSGTIAITNNTPFDAIITGVSDVISTTFSANVMCYVTFPYTLLSGQTLKCTYSADLPDGSNRINAATVTTEKTTQNPVGGAEGKANVVFGDPTNEVNKEVTVEDSYKGSLGTASDSYSWTYERTFAAAGTFDNVATIVETGQSDQASVTVKIYNLKVTKDAKTTFNRHWHWSIDKTGDQTELTLSMGQQFQVNYSVVVDASFMDKDYAVTGNIYVKNPAPIPATISSVSDILPDATNLVVDCGGITFPYVLEAGQTLHCTYSANLPDATQRINKAKAILQNFSYHYQNEPVAKITTTNFFGRADVIFGTTPADEIDECINVSDNRFGDLGSVCAVEAPATFKYSQMVGPYDVPGTYSFINIATFITNDTGTKGSDNHTVTITVPKEDQGCTLTPGYWKTHSKYGPAPYDDTWAQIGEDTPFYYSGQSYYQVLWTESKGGNVYYILAHQYIAAELNFLNGADPSDAQDTFDAATALFANPKNTPTAVGKLKGKAKNDWTKLAEKLDAYNNGDIGPGHCDEEGSYSTSANDKVVEKSTSKKPGATTEGDKNNVQEQTVNTNESLAKAPEQSLAKTYSEIPNEFALAQNYPNPFNPSTTLAFDLPGAGYVRLTIYSMTGQLIATVVNGNLDAGRHTISWQAPADLASGIYLYKLETAAYSSIKRMLLLK